MNRWFKITHKWACGNVNIEYYLVNDENIKDGEIEEWWLDEVSNKYSYSDKYRGIDYEQIPVPPRKWLVSKINNKKREIEFLSKDIDLYQSYLNEQI